MHQYNMHQNNMHLCGSRNLNNFNLVKLGYGGLDLCSRQFKHSVGLILKLENWFADKAKEGLG